MFTWVVYQAHIPILRISQELLTKTEVDGSWKLSLFTNEGSLFSSADGMANITQIDLFCGGLIGVRLAIGLSQQLLVRIASVAAFGHKIVIERLLRQNANVNASRTVFQAAAGGDHLAVVERLRVAGATYKRNQNIRGD